MMIRPDLNNESAIQIILDNREMRTPEQVSEYENALAAVGSELDAEQMRRIHFGFYDLTQQPEVMWGLVHTVERFDPEFQIEAFLDVIEELDSFASEWVETLLYRTINDEGARGILASKMKSRDKNVFDIVAKHMAKGNEVQKRRFEEVLQ